MGAGGICARTFTGAVLIKLSASAREHLQCYRLDVFVIFMIARFILCAHRAALRENKWAAVQERGL